LGLSNANFDDSELLVEEEDEEKFFTPTKQSVGSIVPMPLVAMIFKKRHVLHG
jgi:hypothetical protein